MFNDVLSNQHQNNPNTPHSNQKNKTLFKKMQNKFNKEGTKDINLFHSHSGSTVDSFVDTMDDTADSNTTTPINLFPPNIHIAPSNTSNNNTSNNNNNGGVNASTINIHDPIHSHNSIVSPATENEEMMVEKKNQKLATDLSNVGNSLELKVDCWVSTVKSTHKHTYQHITVFKLPNAEIPSTNTNDDHVKINHTFTVCTLKSKKNEHHHYEKNCTKIICKVEKKRQSACVMVDGVELNGVRFLSISQQFKQGFMLAVATFPIRRLNSTTSCSSIRQMLNDDLDDY
ncbi:hypothetical protein AKO1_012597 [Acrasis kona]|uniref:Phosphofurin acidic cluster sorting protein 1/2 C-terminal domain-containing protein n=1 Tax=Acrasis kona TaxID=1008807 RepID=A0AAW2YY59_9EUKA